MKPHYRRRTGYRSGERRGLLIRYANTVGSSPTQSSNSRRISLVVRMLGFQSGEKGSIPLCAANSKWNVMPKEKREKFNINTFTAMASKKLVKQYEKMGYKHISTKYDDKKEMYINVFK